MSGITHVSSDASIAEIALLLRRDGAVIIRDLLSKRELERFNAELDPMLAEADPARRHINPGVAWFFGERTRHLTGMSGRSAVFRDRILSHPTYMGLCDEILLPYCADYQLNVAHVLDRGPGSTDQMLHRDQVVWSYLKRPHPEIQLASIIALVDFEPEIGATRIVPGSHEWADDREPEDGEIVTADMPAGSAVLYLGSALHGGGANTSSDVWRRAMHVSYVVGWLRTEEEQRLSISLEIARRLPRRSQELLGFGVHDALATGGGYLGTVDLLSPIDLMDEGRL